MSKDLQFKISSALKNIIGGDLISDDFTAVFELVKNSYDAHATRVDIHFKDIYSENARILIMDDGKGMNYDDLINKWLFVAYSAKKEGTEEDSYNYRDEIKLKRAYAGAKGIGRFSCDRLGHTLYLETIKDETNGKIESLETNWDNFEGDLKEEFVNINVSHQTLQISTYGVKKGTVLEIRELKNSWDREKFLKLKDALAKLINPSLLSNNSGFKIILHVEDEKLNDKGENDYREIVNGEIENKIFETLDLKTTKLTSTVLDEKKKIIETSLYEGGKLVYKITEENPFKTLHDVEAEIYYMNASAKNTFTRRMGTQPVNYGHIFVYKNGLRIYPYGERGEDPFKMDNSKAQGRTRYLGTREVLGFISVNEPNDSLKETSSRGDGLIRNDNYFEFVDWFYRCLKRIEKYIIDIVDWGNELSNEDFINLADSEKRVALENLVTNLTKSKGLISFEVAPEIFEILDKKTEFSTQNKLSQISKELERDDFDKEKIRLDLRKVEHDLSKLKQVTEEAEEEAFEKLIKNEELTENLEIEKKKGAFQGAIIGTDKERIIGLQHQIFHSSGRVHRNVKQLLKHLGADNIDKKTEKHIKVISLEAYKINSIANFITKANFNLKASEITADIVDFIKDYINEIYILDDAIIDTQLSIVLNTNNVECIKEFRPLEITTLFDNLISNAEKERTKATNLKIDFSQTKDGLIIEVEDDGEGITEENISKVFNLGFTTTDGSGIGLYQVNDIVVNSLKGSVEVKSKPKSWTKFIIKIP